MERKKQRCDVFLKDKIILRAKELCNIYGHSQGKLKESTGVDVANLESGRNFPSVTTIAIICKFYGITLAEFFDPHNYPSKQ